MHGLKRLQKYSLVAFFCFFSSHLMASEWLLGIEAGRAYQSTDLNIQTANASPAIAAATGVGVGAPLASRALHLSDHDSIIGLMAGFEWLMHPSWITSLEVHVNWGNFVNTENYHHAVRGAPNTHLRMQAQYVHGTRVDLIGRFVLNVPRYWRPYVVLGGYTVRDKLTYGTQVFNGGLISSDIAHIRKRLYGGIVGLGIEMPLLADSVLPMLKNSGVRLEYNYLQGESIKINDNVAPLNGTYRAKSQIHLLKASLVLKHKTSTH